MREREKERYKIEYTNIYFKPRYSKILLDSIVNKFKFYARFGRLYIYVCVCSNFPFHFSYSFLDNQNLSNHNGPNSFLSANCEKCSF